MLTFFKVFKPLFFNEIIFDPVMEKINNDQKISSNKSDMQKKLIKDSSQGYFKRYIKEFFSYSISCFILLLILPIIIETFGISFFKISDQISFKNEARAFFYLSTLIGQLSFSILTKINGGFLIMPLLESGKFIHPILQNSIDQGLGLNGALVCIFVASLLSSTVGIVLVLTKSTNVMLKIPRNIIEANLITSAIFNLKLSHIPLSNSKPKYLMFYFCISIILTLLLIYIYKKTNNPFNIVLYLITLILCLNSLKLILDKDTITSLSFFSQEFHFKNIFPTIKDININFIFSNLKNILPLALMPIISQCSSLLIYSILFPDSININSEIFKLSMSNIFSLISCLPTHFFCTGSIFFRLCGASTKIHSFISGCSLILLIY